MPKVLLVEDDNNLREIFEMRLQAEGYQTITAGNGEEGLTVALSQKPDLIICDVMMPKLSGFEMVENLRAAPEGKDAKVIMMTALGQAEDRSRGEKLGVIKYLVKSQATLEDFARVIREVLPPTGAPANQQEQNNQQVKEKSMPDDQTTNPTPPADSSAPMPAADPMTPPASNPTADSAMSGDQQSTAEEQSTVDAQVNDFMSSVPAADNPAPAGDPVTPPVADATPSMPSAPVPADSAAPFVPTEPSVSNPVAGPAPTDAGMPANDATSMDAPAIPPAAPPADESPEAAPQTEAPATDAPATPPSDSTGSTI